MMLITEHSEQMDSVMVPRQEWLQPSLGENIHALPAVSAHSAAGGMCLTTEDLGSDKRQNYKTRSSMARGTDEY